MTRFVRSAMEVLNQDYIRPGQGCRNARSSTATLRNAAINIATIIGLQMATLLSAVVVIR